MAITVAEVMAKLVMDTKDFVSGAQAAQKATKDTQRSIEELGAKMTDVGKKMSIGLTAPLVGAATIGIKKLVEMQNAAALTAAHIKSTGGAANVTAGHIEEMSASLQDMSGVDEDVIQKGQNMLLTFTNIKNGVGEGNQVFDDATKSVLDMSVAMGTDMQTASIQVGKALQDPIRGVTALRRVGVQLSDTQKEQVAHFMAVNDIAGAQKVILGELQKEFGGSAKAAGDTLGGQLNKMKDAFEEASAAIVGTVLPVFETFVGVITNVAKWIQGLPGPFKTAIAVFLGLAAAAGPLLIIAGKLAAAWTSVTGVLARKTKAAADDAAETEVQGAAAESAAAMNEQLLAVLEALAGALGVQTSEAGAASASVSTLATASGEAAGAVGSLTASLELEAGAAGTSTGAMVGNEGASTTLLGVLESLDGVLASLAQAFGVEAGGADVSVVAIDALAASQDAAMMSAQELAVASGEAAAGMDAAAAAAGAMATVETGVATETSATAGALQAEAVAAGEAAGSLEALAVAEGTAASGGAAVAAGAATATAGLEAEAVASGEAAVGTGMFGTAVGGLVGMINPVTAVLGTLVGLYLILKPKALDAESASKSLTDALMQQGDAGTKAVAALVAQTATQDNAKAAADKLGISTGTLAAAMLDSAKAQSAGVATNTAFKQSLMDQAAAGGEAGKQAQVLIGIMGNFEFDYVKSTKAAADLTAAQKGATHALNDGASAAGADAAATDDDTDSTDALKASKKSLMELTRGSADAALAYGDAQAKVKTDVAAITTATNDLAKSHGAASDSAKKMADAEDKLTNAHKAVKAATDDVAKAQRDLANTPLPEIEIAGQADKVTTAQIGVRTATEAVTAARKELANLGHASEDDLAKAADAVTKAMDAQSQAAVKVKDAQDKVAAASKEVMTIQAEINQVISGNTTHISDFAKALQSGFGSALDPLKKFEADSKITFDSVTKTLEDNLTSFADWQTNLKKLAAGGHTALAQEMAKLGPSAAGAVADAVKKSGPELDHLQSLFQDQADYMSNGYAVDTAKALGDVGIDMDYLGGLQGKLQDSTGKLQGAQDDLTGALDDQKAKNLDLQAAQEAQKALMAGSTVTAEQLQAAQDKVTTAEITLKGAIQTLQGEQQTLNGLQDGSIPSEYATQTKNLQDKQDALTGAQKTAVGAQGDYNSAMKDTSGVAAAQKAQEDLNGAVQTARQSIIDEATAYSTQMAANFEAATGKVADADQKQQWFNDHLGETTSHLQVGSPLRSALDGYIGRLGAVPANIHTEFDMVAKTGDTQKMIQWLTGPAVTSLSPKDQGQLAFDLLGMAKGGPVQAGVPYIVGENQPEVFVPDVAGRIIPSISKYNDMASSITRASDMGPALGAQDSMAGAAMGGNWVTGGDTYVYVTVQGQVVTQEGLVNGIHQGLLAKQRQGGNLGFEGA